MIHALSAMTTSSIGQNLTDPAKKLVSRARRMEIMREKRLLSLQEDIGSSVGDTFRSSVTYLNTGEGVAVREQSVVLYFASLRVDPSKSGLSKLSWWGDDLPTRSHSYERLITAIEAVDVEAVYVFGEVGSADVAFVIPVPYLVECCREIGTLLQDEFTVLSPDLENAIRFSADSESLEYFRSAVVEAYGSAWVNLLEEVNPLRERVYQS